MRPIETSGKSEPEHVFRKIHHCMHSRARHFIMALFYQTISIYLQPNFRMTFFSHSHIWMPIIIVISFIGQTIIRLLHKRSFITAYCVHHCTLKQVLIRDFIYSKTGPCSNLFWDAIVITICLIFSHLKSSRSLRICPPGDNYGHCFACTT